jgi:precorrin-8X/cobalt-precorrin-8 methylmutase
MQQITAPGREIEDESFATIDREVGAHHFTPEQWPVVRRVIHATADFEFKDTIVFHRGALDAGVAALASGCNLVVDVEMIRAGLSAPRLARFGVVTHCFISDPHVIEEASRLNLTRAVAAMRRARGLLAGSVVAVGNAPTALLEVARLAREEGIRPALVIAVPVGFVNAVESKEEVLRLDLPAIVARGRKGGSTIAVAIIHALLALAAQKTGASRRPDGAPAPASSANKSAGAQANIGGAQSGDEARAPRAESSVPAPITVVGIGAGGPLDLSARALQAVRRAALICGGERHLALFADHPGRRFVIRSNLAELARILAEADGPAVVLASGDPNFYGVAKYLVGRLGKPRIEIVPAPSAMQEAFARIKEPWDDAVFVSFHSRPLKIEQIVPHRKVGIFTDPSNTPGVIARALLEAGADNYRAFLCENLGSSNERVRELSLEKLAGLDSVSDLNVLILIAAHAAQGD